MTVQWEIEEPNKYRKAKTSHAVPNMSPKNRPSVSPDSKQALDGANRTSLSQAIALWNDPMGDNKNS